MKHTINVIGMGPGDENLMTKEALDALDNSELIVGYGVYLNLLGDRFKDKEFYQTPMRQEEKRCRYCFCID